MFLQRTFGQIQGFAYLNVQLLLSGLLNAKEVVRNVPNANANDFLEIMNGLIFWVDKIELGGLLRL